jgi:hypothetical protein
MSRLQEVDVEPLGNLMLDFLIEWDKEEAFLDFKETLSIAKNSPFAKIAKGILAFSNYGGGFILVGFREKAKAADAQEADEKRTYLPVGLPEDFHIDQASLQEKFNAYLKEPVELHYREFHRTLDGIQKKFAAIYVPPSTSVLKPIRSGFYRDEKGKQHTAFGINAVLIRRGTQSMVATKEEIDWIQKRAEKEGYRLSVLSGEPDQVQETLYSNLFEVIKIPEVIWTGPLRPIGEGERRTRTNERYTAVYVLWNDRMVTFDDISNPQSPLWEMIEPSGVQKEELAAWLSDGDRQRVVIWLLNKELRFLADRLGLLHESKKQKFYYSCDAEYRTEKWSPRFRASSTLKVAQRIWAQQLGRSIFWHLAVIAPFAYIGNRLYLKLMPTIQLTNNGREAVFGPREGTVITRLMYNRYNSSYLNQIFFWISKMADGKDNIELAQGTVLVLARPVESRINVGILYDRPTAEPVQEIPEVEIIEAER